MTKIILEKRDNYYYYSYDGTFICFPKTWYDHTFGFDKEFSLFNDSFDSFVVIDGVYMSHKTFTTKIGIFDTFNNSEYGKILQKSHLDNTGKFYLFYGKCLPIEIEKNVSDKLVTKEDLNKLFQIMNITRENGFSVNFTLPNSNIDEKFNVSYDSDRQLYVVKEFLNEKRIYLEKRKDYYYYSYDGTFICFPKLWYDRIFGFEREFKTIGNVSVPKIIINEVFYTHDSFIKKIGISNEFGNPHEIEYKCDKNTYIFSKQRLPIEIEKDVWEKLTSPKYLINHLFEKINNIGDFTILGIDDKFNMMYDSDRQLYVVKFANSIPQENVVDEIQKFPDEDKMIFYVYNNTILYFTTDGKFRNVELNDNMEKHTNRLDKICEENRKERIWYVDSVKKSWMQISGSDIIYIPYSRVTQFLYTNNSLAIRVDGKIYYIKTDEPSDSPRILKTIIGKLKDCRILPSA